MLTLACVRRRPTWRTVAAARTRSIVVSPTTACCAIMAPKEKRSAHQARSAHYSSHIRVVNVDNSTAAPSVLLFFDQHRYLFNAGEGIQRHFIEHKQRMNKITHILATRVHTDTLAGLPGMLLSQVQPGADLGKPGGAAVSAAVYGPPGLAGYVDAFRIYATSFGLSVTEVGTGKDDRITAESRVTITPLLIRAASSNSGSTPKSAAAATAAGEEADGSQEPAAKKPRHEEAAAAAAAAADAPNGTPAAAACAGAVAAATGRGMASVHSSAGVQSAVVCYVCQLSTIPGKFDPQKAAQLGVPRGPLYGELQRGKPVTAVSGRTIQPHEVMSTPTTPGPCLVVVDCPSLDYLPALQAEPALQQLQQECQQQGQAGDAAAAAAGGAAGTNGGSGGDGGSDSEVAPRKRYVLVHMGPAAVARSEQYAAWCAGFGPAADHLFVSKDSQLCCTTRRAAQLQAQLNVIEPEVFLLQGFQDQQQQQQQGGSGDAAKQGAAAVTAAAAGAGREGLEAPDGSVFTLVPARAQGVSMDTAITQSFDLEAVQAEVRDNHPQVMTMLQEYAAAKAAVQQQQQEQPDQQLQGVDRQCAALTPLGTCSACPSTHRNVSSYYLDLFDKGGLLMDCGEDSMGQLERRYGRAEADRRIMQLHAVWVSHMHADHHGGLYPLLLRRQALLQQQQQLDSAPAAAMPAQQGAGSDTADGRDQQASAAAAGAAAAGGSAKQLLILGPFPLFRVLCQYSKVLPLAFTFLPNHYFFSQQARQPPAEAIAAYAAVKAAAGLSLLQPFPVQHVANSSGLQVQSERGWKVVFSGDTRPCQAVIDAAKGATLLVHEATFEDELQDEAVAKRHSTTAEALGVAAAAGAYRTLLTHFSTRYPRIPVMKPPAVVPVDGEEAAAEGGGGGSDLAAVGSVLVAFDFMTVNLADLAWMPRMLPVLDELFKEEEAVYMEADDGGGAAEGGGGGAE